MDLIKSVAFVDSIGSDFILLCVVSFFYCDYRDTRGSIIILLIKVDRSTHRFNDAN